MKSRPRLRGGEKERVSRFLKHNAFEDGTRVVDE